MEEVSFKILLLGDSEVGKTSFMTRYLDDNYMSNTLVSVGIDSRIKTFERNNKTVYLRIFDTAGQERFRSIVKNYYKGADGILLMYDVTNLKSFKAIKTWVESIKENMDINEIGLIIIGNKIDLPDKVVGDEEKKEIENLLNTQIIEASAKENINVNEIFDKIVDIMMEKKLGKVKKENIVNDTIKIDKNKIKNNKKKAHCCLASKK